MKFFFLLIATFIFSLPKAVSQASFVTPDTVCVNQPVNITNTSVGANSYYWNFCVADINAAPTGTNLGNINNLFSSPVFMDYVFYNNNYYGFLINYEPGRLVRLNFGNSLLNTPTATNLGNFGGIIPPGNGAEGIQIVYNEGRWYAIIVGGWLNSTPRILKIDFGSDLTNLNPAATNWGNLGNMLQPIDLHVFKEGNNWYGFTVNAENNTITRFNFTSSFNNTPTAINLGNVGNLAYPTGIYAINDNGFWRVFITNAGNNTRSSGTYSLTRLDFGSSLLNTPTGINLGNPGNTLQHPRDLTIMKFCGQIIGFAVNGHLTNSNVVKFNFNNDLSSIPSVTSLGIIGNSSFPHSISKLFRVNNDVYGFITNVDNNTLTRLKFTGCANSSIPNSTDQNPQPIIYSTPGNYNINLTTDDGLPSQSAFCKQVVVMPELAHTQTKNLAFCSGDSILLTSNFSSRNKWNTGSESNSIYARSQGIYWVETTNGACTNRDSFIVTVNPAPFQVNLGNDTSICRSDVLVLNAGNAGASYLWSTGATTQTINVTSPGTYYVTVTTNSCSSKDTIVVAVDKAEPDFQFSVNACNPYTIKFSGLGNNTSNITWDFGDGTSISGILDPSHSFASSGTYNVSYTVAGIKCSNTISKNIAVGIKDENIILTLDTTICLGASKQLRSAPSLSFCWSPTLYLDNPNSPTPTTTATQNIKYYLTAEVVGNNLIANGDFNNGNTGFTSEYNYASTNNTEAQYFVGKNPKAWNPLLSPCIDHTDGNGNMMLVNGSPAPEVEIWRQTISISPNTNYSFSTWIQTVFPDNPAQLQFSINGNALGQTIISDVTTCNWKQFYTTWNSGNSTSAVISIVNKNTLVWGNDFALDDISFAPVFIKRDSVTITVENPVVKTNNDTSFCEGNEMQLISNGASVYSWSPASGLSNPNTANPIAKPLFTTEYVVTGITEKGCMAKDTLKITTLPKPLITLSNDTTICNNTSVQLFASGGSAYSWSPVSTLSDPLTANPLASPDNKTTYYLTATGANGCINTDSVNVDIWPEPLFSISPAKSICLNDSVQLYATGGETYLWQPSSSFSDAHISNPKVAPKTTTTYTVLVSDNCDNSETLSTTVTVLSLPTTEVNKSNDVDCITPLAQLNATGGIKYAWSPTTNINETNISNPVVYPHQDTWYQVAVTGPNGCVAKDSVLILTSFVPGSGNFYIPNAFTPNNDGKNDCFSLKHWGEVDFFELHIFNRWGQQVFHTKNTRDCWNGIFKGMLQPSGTYIYQVSVTSPCTQGVFKKRGFVILIR